MTLTITRRPDPGFFMHIKAFGLCAIFLSSGVCLSAVEEVLPLLPSVQFARENRRMKVETVSAASLVEGSPEWIVKQIYICMLKRDLDALVPYQSPLLMRTIRMQPERVMVALTRVKVDGDIRIGESRFEETRCYVWLSFPSPKSKTWNADFRYFLKREGRWIAVSAQEWQKGEMAVVE